MLKELHLEDFAHLQHMLDIMNSRLQFLEQQEATLGIHTPPYVKLDFDNTRAEIASLEARIAQLSGQQTSIVSDNLLRSANIFVGRQKEIARCQEALLPDDRDWGIVIDGIGGIGKTALALEVAHR